MTITVNEESRIIAIADDNGPVIAFPSEFMVEKMGDWIYQDGAFVHRPLPESSDYSEDRIEEIIVEVNRLRDEVQELRSYINSIGKTELVGKGTHDDPFLDDSNPINNAFYLRNGTLYVYMDGVWAEVDW